MKTASKLVGVLDSETEDLQTSGDAFTFWVAENFVEGKNSVVVAFVFRGAFDIIECLHEKKILNVTSG